ncbi:bifunctional folylpolyglutamate synthase/dihydrofolate synthase [Effusibacillus dendaii]|uniref:tetrahydrofolate synthase n=2 Tax=Effusibacillus dendaii TaxID=2743772 RepID=A0A7I8D4P9_9BACL|nr:bifunctional folylpolyglutamate synthase/dihydrofolate synthase [Effusibacillus dendaii]
MEALLERLGNPHRQMRFLHVAGTNGKGSTCAYLASIYQQAGYRVGRYTSPYIMHFYDRISINGRDAEEEKLAVCAEKLKPHIREISETELGQPTEFEVITLLAILYFLEQKTDLVVWETGLGGRLDATNVVTPLISIITNVGLDHVLLLGPTIEAIAAEKAGIVKNGIPVITAAVSPALEVIAERAKEAQAPLFVLSRDFTYNRLRYSLAGQAFDFRSANSEFKQLEIAMLGEHQCQNAALAVQAVLLLAKNGQLPVSEQALREGLQNTRWPGRLEIAGQQPLVLLDGAHNPHGADALANALGELLEGRKVRLVIGILQDKLLPGVVDPILPFAESIVVTAPNTPRAATVQEVAAFLRERTDVPLRQIARVADAVKDAVDSAKPEHIVLVTGSLYTISEARQFVCGKG